MEFVAGKAVQHHVDKHPKSDANGEDVIHLIWDATLEVGDEVPDEFVEVG